MVHIHVPVQQTPMIIESLVSLIIKDVTQVQTVEITVSVYLYKEKTFVAVNDDINTFPYNHLPQQQQQDSTAKISMNVAKTIKYVADIQTSQHVKTPLKEHTLANVHLDTAKQTLTQKTSIVDQTTINVQDNVSNQMKYVKFKTVTLYVYV